MGVGLSDAQAAQFALYADLLEEWNARMNLTRVPPEQFAPLHFLDSLAAARAVDLTAARSLIDVGTGAGFPGLPLKIAFPALEVTLLDSTRKRLAFLDHVVAELRLSGVLTLHARAEDAAREPRHRERYDLAAARAVAPMDALAELLLPFVRVSGAALALKSAGADAEIEAARPVIGQLGGSLARVVAVSIPGTDVERRLAVVEKVRPTPRRYPRSPTELKRLKDESGTG